MNRVYRCAWNAVRGSFLVIAGTTCGKAHSSEGQPTLHRTALTAALMAAGLVHLPVWSQAALPTGGQVSAGSGTIAHSANQVTVTQTSARLALDWQSFSIGAGNTVRFDQPSASSVALNRVLGPDASMIQGNLQANGQVFLLNPNGVLFTPTAQVSVGSLVASTLNLSNEDFLAGRYRFDGNSTQAVRNEGRIDAASGGTVALIAAQVVNSGTIATPGGATLLAAGQTVTLDLGGPAKLEIERGAVQALIDNGGAILASGGRILLTAKAADALASTVINQSGLLEAQSLGADARGQIVLQAEGGAIVHSGRIDTGGDVSIVLRNGDGSANNNAGITLGTVNAASLTLDSANLGASITAADKTYDGTTSATVTSIGFMGLAFTGSSNLSVAPATGTFADKNAGVGKTVTAGPLQLTGFNGTSTNSLLADGGEVRPTATATITPAILTVTGGGSKVYDGGTGGAANASTEGLTVANWQNFSVPEGGMARFEQPTASTVTINRVQVSDSSAIFGILSSNGQLVLVNPSAATSSTVSSADQPTFSGGSLSLSGSSLYGNTGGGNPGSGGPIVAIGSLSVSGGIVSLHALHPSPGSALANAMARVQGQPLRPSLPAGEPSRGPVKLQVVRGDAESQ